jgi:hypothetical protein
LFIDDNAMSNSAAIEDDNGGFSNAHPQPNQQPINATANTALADLASQSSGLFIRLSADSKAQ